MGVVDALHRVAAGLSLTADEAEAAMGEIMEGKASPAQLGGLLVALRMKGESVAEIVGFARAMRARMVPVRSARIGLVDTCGTGGDSLKTFNLSTAAAFIAAGAGAPVAKHGNRAVTSKCGSADVLSALGVNLDVSAERAGKILDEVGIVFLFAPNHHPAMKHAAGPRKELGLRTVFNILGPLCNPAGAAHQVVGVYEKGLLETVAESLSRLGCTRGMVVHGEVGIDEVSPIGPTHYALIEEGSLSLGTLHPEELGIVQPSIEEIAAGESPEANAEMIREALADDASARGRAVLPGAAAALFVAGVAESFEEGVAKARESVRQGWASEKLRQLVEASCAE
jgi:anthranilate phosphoribosyltransferase